ncbi:MAG: hypothetical protein H6Q82_1371 [Deltaproteobacteria bacterium]|nr:hypothetical protein [Deltaproteobacteria bacterium]
MKSNSKRETTLSPIAAGRPFLPLLAFAILFSVFPMPFPANAGVSPAEMARLEASDAVTIDGTRSLFNGYISLGLLPEASSLLEKRVRLGVFPAKDAAPLFDEVVSALWRFDDPKRLAAFCETALSSGIRTPLILYSYGTGLRGMPGRLGDASGVLAQVRAEEPYRLLALYSLGQIAAERGETGTALDLFRRVEEDAGGVERGGFLAMRAARSRAELLLSSGKPLDAAPVFEALLRNEKNPLDRIGLAAAGDNSVHDLEHLPAEMIAGPPRGPGPVFPYARGDRTQERAPRDGSRSHGPGGKGIGGCFGPAVPAFVRTGGPFRNRGVPPATDGKPAVAP